MNTIRASVPSRLFASVREAFRNAGIPIAEGDKDAILCWFDSLTEGDRVFQGLGPYQIINRIPNINVLCRKTPLARILQRTKPYFPSSLFSFMPKTYILPFQNSKFVRALARGKTKYIYKPDSGSLGHGIAIVEPNSEFQPDETLAVAQQYIDSFLLDNKKFDLRIYVLVASVDPLEIFVYRDGLARFCTEEIDNKTPLGQLTNVAINHDSRILSKVLERMRVERGVDIERLWKRIDEAIALTVISAYTFIAHGVDGHQLANDSYSRCFQILGFDILLDQEANPYVLEVNYRPSLDTHFPAERRLKVDMIKSSIMIGAPVATAQRALNARKWGWTPEAWRSFLARTPEIAKAAQTEKQNAINLSKFERIWPSQDPEKAVWKEVLNKAKELPIEDIPGVSSPFDKTKDGTG